MTIKAFPHFQLKDERKGSFVMLKYSFSARPFEDIDQKLLIYSPNYAKILCVKI